MTNSRDDEERSAKIAGIIIYSVFGALGLLVILLVFPATFGLAELKVNAKDIDIRLQNFEVVDSILVVHLSVINNGKASVKKLDANVHVHSDKMQLTRTELFNLIKPTPSLDAGGVVSVDARFTLLRSPYGLVDLTWEATVMLVE